MKIFRTMMMAALLSVAALSLAAGTAWAKNASSTHKCDKIGKVCTTGKDCKPANCKADKPKTDKPKTDKPKTDKPKTDKPKTDKIK
jgi:hypothetical protein